MNKPHQGFYRTLIAALLTPGIIFSVHANSLQSHGGISHAVKQFVLQQNVPLKNIQVNLTSLNKQLQLPKCAQTLQVNMAPGTKLLGHSSLSVSCAAPQWKIHVAAHIDGEVDALVTRHPIPRGAMIQADDLKFTRRRYSQLNHGYYDSAKLLNNMEAKRNIRVGQVLTPSLLKAQKLVLRGQHITIVAQSGGLNLRVKGKALMDGQQGQTIKVKNLNSKKLIYARVISAGMVKVNF
ncbi:MAG: flagellar basal body P-ring formation chaperone FlgA [Gammaproteobacteria bacterium]|nr:flagellar basal body P-ring formation chaperone FlgA [Gammaproteobacteria bacterium]